MTTIKKGLFCISISAFMLTGFIFFSTLLFSEEPQKRIVETESLPERRIIHSNMSPAKEKKEGKKKDGEKGEKNDGEKGYPNVELGGAIMWDYNQFNGIHIGRAQKEYRVGNETELRRACIDIKSEIDKDWQAEFEVSFEEGIDAPEVTDAFIEFKGWDDCSIIIGQAKEPFGLEELTSSKYITCIERSMAAIAFSPGHSPGLGLTGNKGIFTWSIGAYEADDLENKRDTHALTGRLTITPWDRKGQVFHIGVAGSLRDFGGEPYRIKERAEVHTAEEIVVSGITPADDVHLLGAELAWVYGPFSLQSEYVYAMIKAVADNNDVTYAGYYLQGSYFVTGESRPYKKGMFSRIKPGGRYGALELVSRYSFLDADDDNRGVSAENLTLGMNYYIKKQVRLMINYIKTCLTDCISKGEGKADAVSSRIQYDF